MPDPHRRDYAFLAPDAGAETHDEQMYSGALSFCRRRYARDLAGVDVAVLGVPYDASVTNRPGARFGPRAIRAASAQLAWSRAWPSPFDPFERLAVVDWGDVHLDPGRPETVAGAIEAAVGHVLDAGARALMLGGDHFTSYPALRAHAARHGPLALIQVDSHTDTWPDPPGTPRLDHGTMFARAVAEGLIDPARSIQVGIRTTNDAPLGIEILDAAAMAEMRPAEVAATIRTRVGAGPAYLSFDIDGIDPAFAPGTGTPVCGGPSTREVLAILRSLSGIALVGADVVEVAPAYDVSEITALAGATVALTLLCLMAEGGA